MSDEGRIVSDVDTLLALVTLKSVVFNEVSAHRTDDEDERDRFRMEVSSMLSEEEVAVRCRAVVAGAGGAYVAEAEGHFDLSEPVGVDPPVMMEFVERVGVMVVYPYLRTAISDGASRIGRKTPVLRLLRPGDVKLEPPQSDNTPERTNVTKPSLPLAWEERGVAPNISLHAWRGQSHYVVEQRSGGQWVMTLYSMFTPKRDEAEEKLGDYLVATQNEGKDLAQQLADQANRILPAQDDPAE